MLILRRDLRLRPLLNPGESLAGYLYRLLDDNGHVYSAELTKLLRVLYCTYAGERLDAATHQLSCVLGAACTVDVNYSRNGCESWGWRERWSKKKFALRFCPPCLAEHPYHLALWELPEYSTCNIHRGVLVDRCPACERTLKWTELQNDWHCACDSPLLTRRNQSRRRRSPVIAREPRYVPHAYRHHHRLARRSKTIFNVAIAYRPEKDRQIVKTVLLSPHQIDWSVRQIRQIIKAYVGGSTIWVSKKVHSGKHQLEDLLLKVRTLQCRTKEIVALTTLDEHEEAKLLNHLLEIENQTKTRVSVQRFSLDALGVHKAGLPLKTLVLLSPKFSTERRIRILNQFLPRWKSCGREFRSCPKLQRDFDRRSAKPLAPPQELSSNTYRELLIVCIINQLLQAATAKLQMANVGHVLQRLPPLRSATRRTDSVRILSSIARQLARLPMSQLGRMHHVLRDPRSTDLDKHESLPAKSPAIHDHVR
jgi:hypothetical protein